VQTRFHTGTPGQPEYIVGGSINHAASGGFIPIVIGLDPDLSISSSWHWGAKLEPTGISSSGPFYTIDYLEGY